MSVVGMVVKLRWIKFDRTTNTFTGFFRERGSLASVIDQSRAFYTVLSGDK